MQLEILTFCDAAVEYAGRLNLLGASDTILVNEMPFRLVHCALVMRVRAARIEQGDHAVRVMIIDADGEPVLNIQGQMSMKLAPNSSGAMNMIINAQNLEFKQEGEYSIEMAVDGIQLGSSPLYVRRVPAPRPA